MPTRIIRHKVAKNPRLHGPKAQWSDRQKLEAVTCYLMVGKWPLVSDATKIPIDTLKKWKQADWWKELEEEVRRSSNLATAGKLANIRDKAAGLVLDRLEHGDFQYDPRSGKFRRAPLKARIANDIMKVAIEKEMLLQKIDEQPRLREEAIMDRLKLIQSQLLNSVNKIKPVGDVIDLVPEPQKELPINVASDPQ